MIKSVIYIGWLVVDCSASAVLAASKRKIRLEDYGLTKKLKADKKKNKSVVLEFCNRLLVAIFLFTSLKCTTANAFAKQGLEKTDKDQISRAGQNQTLLIIINNPTFVGNDQSRALKYIFRATSQIHLFSRDPLSFKN